MANFYIGVDPSTKTGFVALDAQGNVISETEITSPIKDDPQRFIDLTQRVFGKINGDCKVFIEGFSYQSSGRSVSTQYGIGWTMRIFMVENNIPYIDIPPTSLKKFASGKGNAKKENMILPIYKKWGYEHKSDNVRDAYVLAQIGRYLDELETPTKYQKEALSKINI